jgi:3-oxoacyl-ACP reductase-like protein
MTLENRRNEFRAGPNSQQKTYLNGGDSMNWKNSRVLITGGASFIGSAIVDALVEGGARKEVATAV